MTDFAAVAGVDPGSVQTSATKRLVGHDGIVVSVSGSGVQYRLCVAADCSDRDTGAWVATPSEAARDAYVQLRATAPAGGTTLEARLQYGGQATAWNVSSKVATSAAYTAMGISDPGLNAALTMALGSGPWAACSVNGGSNTCAGASETLIVHSLGGVRFGIYGKGNLLGVTSCWTTREGFYFTNAPGFSGYLVNTAGAATTAGSIGVCGTTYNSILHIGPIAYASATNTFQYANNGQYWTAGKTLSGTDGNPNTTVYTNVTVYKR